jgi:metal-responsive CopG/Arc/MetJ family transcriptional regulator
MKAIQITFDEDLLHELDATDEVREHGRSAVLRQAAVEYLVRRRRQRVAESYRKAYGDGEGLGDEFAGWEEQGQWPAE